MKKKDLILAGGILFTAFFAWALIQMTGVGEKQSIRITVDGKLYGEYSLEETQVIEIGSTNTCEIKDGKVKMIQADCPDQLCVHQKALDGSGGTIVCLPNRVVIEEIGPSGTGEQDVIAKEKISEKEEWVHA